MQKNDDPCWAAYPDVVIVLHVSFAFHAPAVRADVIFTCVVWKSVRVFVLFVLRISNFADVEILANARHEETVGILNPRDDQRLGTDGVSVKPEGD